jgi:GT2 family glycosyltransferase
MKIIENDKTLGAVGSFVLDKGKEDSIQNLFLVEKKKYINNYILETSFTAITNQELETGVIGVTGLTGCCFLYRKELIQEPFPSFYFAYAEDTYLSQLITLK